MDAGIQYKTSASDDVLHYLSARDAALWIGNGIASSSEEIDAVARLAALPWRLVICDSSSADLAQAFASRSQMTRDRLASERGFINVVASNPEGLVLPPRTLPIYLLNGRDDAQNRDESPQIGKQGMNRRRSNMIGRLLDAKPQLIVVISGGAPEPIADVIELWREESFRAHVTVVSSHEADTQRLTEWMSEQGHPPLIQLVNSALPAFVSDLALRIESRISDTQLTIQLRWDGEVRTLDVTDCELIENPILDRYDLIRSRDLQGVLPHELTDESIETFFDRSAFANRSAARWLPYAAGLPWVRDNQAVPTVLEALRKVEDDGADENALLVLPSEPGAGGTTVARALAFEVAKAGYPTLVASPAYFRPEVTELSRFLLRVRQKQLQLVGEDAATRDADTETLRLNETPWLIVFDVQHWRGKEDDLAAFVRRLSQERRAAVVLTVIESSLLGNLRIGSKIACDTLTHELTAEEAGHLGVHLNTFLRPRKRDRSTADWLAFWESHSPKVGSFGSRPAAFWVALEFFLKRQIDLREPIQAWLLKKFKDADISNELRRVLLEIAALSVERQPYPEALLPAAAKDQYPYSVQLETLRQNVPALALARYSTATDRQWAVSHDLLARYLINAAFADRSILQMAGVTVATDPILLRLSLLEAIATRPELARTAYLPLALEFAVNILKLDRAGNGEFFQHWREVLRILELMPNTVWDTSRTFNHHVAVSRRRIVRDNELFDLSLTEKREQLKLAIEHLNYALTRLNPDSDNERDLNLYNSMARAYLDWAEIERAAGTDQAEVRRLSELAAEAARKAYQEDPQNPYVIETFARDLLQHGRLYEDKAIANACEALVHIFQALRLDTAPLRQQQLSYLVQEAVDLLRTATATEQIDRLYNEKNAVGFIAKAWLLLATDSAAVGVSDLQLVPKDRLAAALAVLEETPDDKRTWITLNLQYQLLCALKPHDFTAQLKILDELETARFRLTLQQQLERALLLHQKKRHTEANETFRSLRREMRERDAFVDVPARLRTLLDEKSGRPMICDGIIVDASMYRTQAKVPILGSAEVRLIPQDFGQMAMTPGTRFKCHITFGWKGPLAKPVSAAGA